MTDDRAKQNPPTGNPNAAVFVERCRLCGAQIETDWGPDVHAESRRRNDKAHVR